MAFRDPACCSKQFLPCPWLFKITGWRVAECDHNLFCYLRPWGSEQFHWNKQQPWLLMVSKSRGFLIRHHIHSSCRPNPLPIAEASCACPSPLHQDYFTLFYWRPLLTRPFSLLPAGGSVCPLSAMSQCAIQSYPHISLPPAFYLGDKSVSLCHPSIGKGGRAEIGVLLHWCWSIDNYRLAWKL